MRKFCFLLVLFLCGCGVNDPVRTSVDNVIDTKVFSARESIKGYAASISMAYMNYLSGGVDGSTMVNVDGVLVGLDVDYSGSSISCDDIRIVGGLVKLYGCVVYGYEFDYDGDVIKK